MTLDPRQDRRAAQRRQARHELARLLAEYDAAANSGDYDAADALDEQIAAAQRVVAL
jgi:hypothetical protein